MAAPFPSVNALVNEQAPDKSVELPASHPLVVATPFLGWAPGRTVAGVAHVRISQALAIAAFTRRCSTGTSPADYAAASAINLLLLALRAVSWTRILDQLIASGLLNSTMVSFIDLLLNIKNLALANRADLEIGAADWLTVEGTDAQQAVAAPQAGRGRGAGRGQGAAPAPVAARDALSPALHFLTLVDIPSLEDAGLTPWNTIGFYAGALGSCLTQDARNWQSSHVQITGRSLFEGCRKRYQLGATADAHAVAANLHDYGEALTNALPSVMVPDAVGPHTLSRLARDSTLYLGGDSTRPTVEAERIYYLGRRCVPCPRRHLALRGCRQ